MLIEVGTGFVSRSKHHIENNSEDEGEELARYYRRRHELEQKEQNRIQKERDKKEAELTAAARRQATNRLAQKKALENAEQKRQERNHEIKRRRRLINAQIREAMDREGL
jgi:hypothetical protein